MTIYYVFLYCLAKFIVDCYISSTENGKKETINTCKCRQN